MAKVDYKDLATKLLNALGGADNIVEAQNCMTRLRCVVKDPAKVNVPDIKKVDGVLQVINDGSLLQVVLGLGRAQKITTEFNELVKKQRGTEAKADIKANPPKKKGGITKELSVESNWEENKAKVKANSKKRFGWLGRGVRHLANIFTPLIPAVIAAGLFAALASIVNQFGANNVFNWTTAQGHTAEEIAQAMKNIPQAVKAFYYLFQAFNKGFLTYITLAVGYNAAKEFGASPVLGLMIGGICIADDITNLAISIGLGDGGNNSVLKAGKGGVIGVIVACLLLAVVEKFLRKRMPNSIDTVVTPFLTMLIVGCVYVFGIMIVTGYISFGIVWVITKLTMNDLLVVRLVAGFFAGALFLPMVMCGMHQGLVAFYTEELAAHGYISLYPALAMAGAGQVGAAIALWIKAHKVKNNTVENNVKASIVPGILGVGEPLIYSVTLPLGLPFLTAGLGAGIAGAFCMAMRIGSTAWGPSGFIAIPLMTWVDGKENALGMAWYTVGLIIAIIFGFLFTWFIIKQKRLEPKQPTAEEVAA